MRRGLAAAPGLLALAAAAPAQARQIAVPRGVATIQAAMDAARPGDEISVVPGTCTEEIVIANDQVLRGAGVGWTNTTAMLRGNRIEHTTDVPVRTFTCGGSAATANVEH